MSRVVKATQAERDAYRATNPVYPLYGYITVDGHRCEVEDLRGSWSAPDPVYEIIAPEGMYFAPSWCKHLLAHSLKDVGQRLMGEHLSTHDPYAKDVK